MTSLLSRIGPGIMLAATAVGVSHLVWSTQAGGTYGLSLVWVIILIVVMKYPAFRFAVDYASSTGKSLVTAYSKVSKVALTWLAVGFAVDMFIAVSAVTLVTSGLIISVFDLPYAAPHVAVGLMVLSAAILINGQYARAELLVKLLVLSFSVIAVLTTFLSIPTLGVGERALFAELTPDRSLAVFIIAMAGWMPMPSNGAIHFSKWICEKKQLMGDEFDHGTALKDFKIGYGLALGLALCFVVMGTAVLFETGREVPGSPGGFATELLGIFTSVMGDWIYPLISVAAIAVIWSTQIALMDVCPRVTDRLIAILTGAPDDAPSRFRLMLAIQVVGVSLILLFFMSNFATFIAFATSMGFVASPAIAYYNHRVVTSEQMDPADRPSSGMLAWSWAGIIFLTAFALAFAWTSLG